MQELRTEMTGRIKTLQKRAAYCEDEIAEHRGEIEKLATELAQCRTLEAQYRTVLDGLPKP